MKNEMTDIGPAGLNRFSVQAGIGSSGLGRSPKLSLSVVNGPADESE
jgi:hypothetical protein